MNKEIWKIVNISEVLGYMLILPPATGTRNAVEVFKHFPFATFYIRRGKLVYSKDGVSHAHNPDLFMGHEKYKAIMTCKNPYSRWVSRFKLEFVRKNNFKSKFNFQELFYENLLDQFYVLDLPNNLRDTEFKFFRIQKEISHKIRTENILEDYRSIPFIGGSEFDKSGQLEEILNQKTGKFRSDEYKVPYPEDWKDFYTQETADMVYKLLEAEFKLNGYHKDSWKK